jgi:peptide-methionine (S)-S-oxide reductase
VFWENHDPTQGMRQGNDVGTHAEDYHQQYLHKNPWGYCGIGGTGVSCPVGLTSG